MKQQKYFVEGWLSCFFVNLLRLIAISSLSPYILAAATIGEVYIKNNNKTSAAVWINGQYQGYVMGGEVCYTVVEGFVTEDSGFNSKGELQMTYAYGGWKTGPTLDLRALTWKDKDTPVIWTSSLADNVAEGSGFLNSGRCRFWIGGDPAMTEDEYENATKIHKGGFGMPLEVEGMDNIGPSKDLEPLNGGNASGRGPITAVAALGRSKEKDDGFSKIVGVYRLQGKNRYRRWNITLTIKADRTFIEQTEEYAKSSDDEVGQYSLGPYFPKKEGRIEKFSETSMQLVGIATDYDGERKEFKETRNPQQWPLGWDKLP